MNNEDKEALEAAKSYAITHAHLTVRNRKVSSDLVHVRFQYGSIEEPPQPESKRYRIDEVVALQRRLKLKPKKGKRK
jgi:hypothetical protein